MGEWMTPAVPGATVALLRNMVKDNTANFAHNLRRMTRNSTKHTGKLFSLICHKFCAVVEVSFAEDREEFIGVI